MTLPHYPFQPTPDSSDWDPTLDPYHNDTKYFGEMVAYMDKLVGDLIDVVDELGLSEDTLIILQQIMEPIIVLFLNTEDRCARGKRKMTGDATQVPFLMRWPKYIQKEIKIDGLIDFSDVFATLRDVVGLTLPSNIADQQDGVSFAFIGTAYNGNPRS